MIKFITITLLEGVYDWNKMSLFEFLQEGNIPNGWEQFFERKDVHQKLIKISNSISNSISKSEIIFPMIEHVFRAFIPLEDIKVVILGQDPFHNGSKSYNGSAMGLCFSVKDGNRINPSLRNIYKEIVSEGFSPNQDGKLFHWKEQGCFLLNASLTVERGNPGSHYELWKDFSKLVIEYIVNNTTGVVWLLMGKHAQYYNRYISSKHVVFFTTHPSPFSCNKSTKDAPAFLGSGVFKAINNVLDSDIKW